MSSRCAPRHFCAGTTVWSRAERLGGGTVESYPEDIEGRAVSASFLHNGTVLMFESHGFERIRRLGDAVRAGRSSFAGANPKADRKEIAAYLKTEGFGSSR